MKITKKTEICFQCGKPRIQTKQFTEYVFGSAVVTTESICSDSGCQKRTTDTLEKEKQKRNMFKTGKPNYRFAVKK